MKHAIILALVLAACGGNGGDDDDGPLEPKLITGGGVSSGAVDGTLYVHVVEIDTATPIAGAAVLVDGTTLTTDAAGLATFQVSGPQTITATSSGHAATTWFGVNGANATIPLEPAQRTIPTARVSGTIAGWNNLPNPSFGHYTLGLVLYSFLDDPAAPENSIAQPMNGTTPLNTCLNTGLSNNCAWQMNARVGQQIHTAVIVDGDTNGTSSDISDDTYTLIGYAVGSPMTLTAGQQVTGESLAMVNGTMPLSVTFPAALATLPHVIAIPELALGDAGRIVFPLPTVAPGATTIEVLAPTGALAGNYEVVALATPSAAASTTFSSAFVHDVTGTATIPAWLPTPAISAGASFTLNGTGAFRTAQLVRGKTVLWNITVLDGTKAFTLPTLTPDPLGTGSIDFRVTTADLPTFDAADFAIPTVKRELTRASGLQTTFTR
jgi:hypothetical protein